MVKLNIWDLLLHPNISWKHLLIAFNKGNMIIVKRTSPSQRMFIAGYVVTMYKICTYILHSCTFNLWSMLISMCSFARQQFTMEIWEYMFESWLRLSQCYCYSTCFFGHGKSWFICWRKCPGRCLAKSFHPVRFPPSMVTSSIGDPGSPNSHFNHFIFQSQFAEIFGGHL